MSARDADPATPHVTINEMAPYPDFACCWRRDAHPRYTLRVPSHQLMLVETGRLQARSIGPELEAGPGDLLCLGRTPRTCYGFDGQVCYWETHVCFAPPPRAALPLWIDGRPIPELVRMGTHAQEARAAFETMCREIDRRGDTARARVRSAVFALVAAIGAALGRESHAAPLLDAWGRARMTLASGFERPLALEALARPMRLSVDHFIRGFRRRFGLSPMAYRSQARLREAAHLLAGGAVAVKEVSHRLGFADAGAFTRAFRRRFGLTPSEWKIAPSDPPPTPAQDLPFAVNRHIRPPEATTPMYLWG